tara:strand:- start:515 stop:670 length:156 start_codon:yes stop_codon:yes gene_type:complete
MHRLIKTDTASAVRVTFMVTARDPINEGKFEIIDSIIIVGGGNKYHFMFNI